MGTGALAMRISEFDGDHGLTGSRRPDCAWARSACFRTGIARSTASTLSRGSGECELGTGMESRRDEVARPQRRHRACRRASVLPPELHGSRPDVDRQFRRSPAPLHARLDRSRIPAVGICQGNRCQDRIGDGSRSGRPLGGLLPYVVGYQSTHIQGGTVMGLSPESSVVNRYQQHWDVHNLWVLGASACRKTRHTIPR